MAIGSKILSCAGALAIMAGCAAEEPMASTEQAAVSGLTALVSEAQFNSFFPHRSSFYKYADLVDASALIPGFATTGDRATRKREVAAFFANVAQESGYLQYVEEINKNNVYCDPRPGCGCSGTYYGRGPLQLSWNLNYCAAGAWLGRDYVNNPQLLHTNPVDSWRASMWFWMTQSGAGTVSPHDAVVKHLGFGETIRAINGALECEGRAPEKVGNRVRAYKEFCRVLGVEPGHNLECLGPKGSARPQVPGDSGNGNGGGGGGGGGGGWIDMRNDNRACDNHVGAKCGWAASDNGEGYVCTDHGTWTGCEPAAPPASSWIDMRNDNRACDGHVGAKCGWAASDNGEAYVCTDHGSWTDCEPR